MSSYTYPFTQANGALPSPWVDYTSPGLTVVSNAAVAASANTFTMSAHPTAVDTDDFRIVITVGPMTESDQRVFSYIRTDSGGSNYIGTTFNDNTTWEIVYNSGGGDVSVATTPAGVDFTAADTLVVAAIGRMVRMYKNGISQLTWIDGTGASNKGSSYRCVLMGASAGETNKGIDAVTIEDIPPTGITIQGGATAAITTSRSPSVTFTGYVPRIGDVVLLWPSSTTTAQTITEPSGWINPLGAGVDVESDAHQICCVYHIVTPAEESGVTTTYTATNLYGATTTGNVSGVVVRGVNPANPIDSANSTFDSTNTVTPHVLASLTGSNLSTGSMVFSCVAKDGTGAYATLPSGWVFVNTSNTNQGKALLMLDALTTAGSNVAATNITPSGGDEYASITVALNKLPIVSSNDSVAVTRAAFY
jgi:hypothetical protein